MHRPGNPPFLKKSGCLTLVGWWRHWLTCLAALAHGSLVSSSANQTGYTTNHQSCPKAFFKKGNSAKPLRISRGTTSTIFLTILQVQTHAFNLLRVRDDYIYHFLGHTPCILQSPNTCFFHDPGQVDPHFYSSFKGYNHSSHDRNHRGRPETSIYFYIFYLIQVPS